MAAFLSEFLILFLLLFIGNPNISPIDAAYWCVARSEASYQSLQTALDYACAAGADCTPLLSNGLCYLPNTIQAHSSYAFNSFFQRKAMAPGSCDFAGSATIAQTDPSYGSCVYPSSISTAGGASTPTPTNTNPSTVPTATTTPSFDNGGATVGGTNGINPVFNPTSTTTPPDNSEAPSSFMIPKILVFILLSIAISISSQTM